MKSQTIFLLVCAIMAATNPAQAKDTAMPMKPLTMSETAFEKHPSPSFSDEQLERVHAIKVKYDDISSPRDTQLQKLYQQIFDALNQQTLDRDAISGMQSKINKLEADEANDDLQMMIELHEVLTAEQRTNLRRHALEQEAVEGSMAPPIMPSGLLSQPSFGNR